MTPQVLSGHDPARGIPVQVTVVGGVITSVRDLPPGSVPGDRWILPGLLDIQVNGFAGIDLNGPDIDPPGVARMLQHLQTVGVTRCCPTICTQSHERMVRALRVLAEACRRSERIRRAVVGIHIEGPYLSAEDGPRGAHPRAHVRPPDWEEFTRFQQAADGRIRIVTLAPEWPEAPEFIHRASSAGVVVAIGHTAAEPETIRRAIAAGARLSTHLGNGSHAVLPRHPNYIWEQLAADELWASIIVDGHHLPPSVVKSFVRAKGVGRTILISDAVALAGMPPGDYDWLGLKVRLSPEGRVGLAGTPYLAGSALELLSALPKVVACSGVTMADAVAMASANPARLLGIAANRMVEGGSADLVLARHEPGTDRIRALRTIVGGETVWDQEMTSNL
jgi:N-acetylglucosamine-6-phosphate deacetylase